MERSARGPYAKPRASLAIVSREIKHVECPDARLLSKGDTPRYLVLLLDSCHRLVAGPSPPPATPTTMPSSSPTVSYSSPLRQSPSISMLFNAPIIPTTIAINFSSLLQEPAGVPTNRPDDSLTLAHYAASGRVALVNAARSIFFVRLQNVTNQ